MAEGPVKIHLKLSGGEGGVIPKGVVEDLLIEVVDFGAGFKFKSVAVARAFARHEDAHGIESVYSERLQKAFCRYPGMRKKELAEFLMGKLKELSR